jgi:hypothetical protein
MCNQQLLHLNGNAECSKHSHVNTMTHLLACEGAGSASSAGRTEHQTTQLLIQKLSHIFALHADDAGADQSAGALCHNGTVAATTKSHGWTAAPIQAVSGHVYAKHPILLH